jgi:1,4-dihydroxy-2-naphthoate polyprenyltransferase
MNSDTTTSRSCDADNVTAVRPWEKLRGYAALARAPFHSVGAAPYAVGAFMAADFLGAFHWGLWVWGTTAVVLVMLSTYLAGERFDLEEDRISGELGRSRFAGGTGVVEAGVVPLWAPLAGSVSALIAAGAVGLFIVFHYDTGPLTIPLGLLGMAGGFFYSTPPLRWVSTGLGEVWIAVCYGFLPVTVGYYLPTGLITPLVLAVGFPIACTIFNVILANEYPDYPADFAAGKRNALVRLGRSGGARLYAAAAFAGACGVLLSWGLGAPTNILLYSVPSLLCSGYAAVRLLRGAWMDREELELLCGLGIAANLAMCAGYIGAFFNVSGR